MIEGNLLIRASAGTGKTFSLATRFIRLMLFDGVEPERIVALTFSRAAAQEIYTALLKRLWEAAKSPEGAERERENLLARLSGEKRAEVAALGIAWTQEKFAELLRKVVNTQHTGAIATLDSFILRLVGNFPLELGFQHAVEVLDPAGEKEAVDQAARAILSRPQDSADFAQAFRTARKGSFARMCARTLGDMMEREGWRKFILEHPECKSWTAAGMAQSLGLSDFGGFGDASDTETSRVLGMVTEKKPAGWQEKFVAYLTKVAPGETPIPSGSTIPIEFARAVARHPGKPFVEHRKKLKDGTFEIERCDYPQAVFDAARADLGRLADAFFRRQLEIVEAKIRLFAIIEREYDASTRRSGKLTFQDFTNAARDDSKLELDNLRFRFDSRLDHWALDEFQDTSEVQWICLRSLVESAASSGAGRSVIAVGDLKQSIYTWRGGDDKPFEEMMGWPWFTADYGRIENSKVSYRYGQRIADFINRVFGERNIRNGGLIPASRSSAAERWLRGDCWLEHVPDRKDDGTPRVADYVKVVSVRPDGDSDADDEVVAALYRELESVWPARNAAGSSESVGVLVRRNEDGAKVAEYLRQKGLPVVWEGMNAVCDMPVVQAVINLLKLAEHPQDTFAWVAVNQLLPVRELLFPGLSSASAVSAKVAEMLSHQGLARTLRDFCGKLCESENGLDGLSCSRLRSLVRLGVDYERRRSSDCDIDGFVRFIASAGKRESAASANAIRILSIHRSKGLTLGRVFVPLFEGTKNSIVEPTAFSALFGKGRAWVLPHLASDVAALNDETNTVLEEQRDARLLEQLRLYYVALTRSRNALYVIFPSDDHDGLLFRDLVKKAVDAFTPYPANGSDVLFEDGEVPPFAAAEVRAACGRHWAFAAAGPRVERVSPSRSIHAVQSSDYRAKRVSADVLFEEEFGMAARHGVDVHAAFQKIEWADAKTAAALPAEFREAFVKPAAAASVWRERGYELFDGKRWETGQFDRVVFVGAGESRVATIYDFKTNAKGEGESERVFAERMRGLYAAQMNAYRRALCRLTGMSEEKVSARLLLEATGRVVSV